MRPDTIDLTMNFEKSYRRWKFRISGFYRYIREHGEDQDYVCDLLNLVRRALSDVSHQFEELEKVTVPNLDTFRRYETSLSCTKAAFKEYFYLLSNDEVKTVPLPQKSSEGEKLEIDGEENLRGPEGKEELTAKTVVEEGEHTKIKAEDEECVSVPTSSILAPPVEEVPSIQHIQSPQSKNAAPLSVETSAKMYGEGLEEPRVENKVKEPTTVSTPAFSTRMVGGRLATHCPYVKLPAILPTGHLLKGKTCRKYRKFLQDLRSKRRKGRIKVRLRKN